MEVNLSPVARELAAHPLLAGIFHHHLMPLESAARIVVFRAGERIFDEGGDASRFWLIIDGLVALDLDVRGRDHPPIETLGAGEVLGWSWIFAPRRWHFGASAVQDTRVLELSAGMVDVACDVDPVLGHALTRRFLGIVVERLQNSRLRLLDLYATSP